MTQGDFYYDFIPIFHACALIESSFNYLGTLQPLYTLCFFRLASSADDNLVIIWDFKVVNKHYFATWFCFLFDKENNNSLKTLSGT